MKKILIFSLGLFLLFMFIIFTGCKKDPIIEPIIPPATLQHHVNINTDTATIGSIKVATWESNANFVVLNVNGEIDTLSPNGTRQITISQESLINFTFVLDTISETENFVIPVFGIINPGVPTISVTYEGLWPFNTTDTIFWTTNEASSLLINGVNFPVNGYLILDSLRKDTILHFFVSGSGGTITEDAEILVGDPIDEDYLCAFGPFRLHKLEYQIIATGQWYNSPITPGSDADIGLENYYYDHKFTFTVNGQIKSNTTWDLVPPNFLKIGNVLPSYYYFLEQLNADSMVRRYNFFLPDSVNTPIVIRTHYYHDL